MLVSTRFLSLHLGFSVQESLPLKVLLDQDL